MASSLEFVQYVCEQSSGAGKMTYKKMFGDYGVYCNGKIIGLVCDNQFFVKKTAAGASVLPDCAEASPYDGAKLHYLIEDVENRELMSRFISATYDELPASKPKKKKSPEH